MRFLGDGNCVELLVLVEHCDALGELKNCVKNLRFLGDGKCIELLVLARVRHFLFGHVPSFWNGAKGNTVRSVRLPVV
jgi:hypothetical protein